MVKEVKTLEEFEALLKGESKLIVVDFTASWCGPCQMIKPHFEKMAEDNTDVVFIKVDVDENSDTAEKVGISCMPTFHFYKGGEKVEEMQGANIDGLKSHVEKLK